MIIKSRPFGCMPKVLTWTVSFLGGACVFLLVGDAKSVSSTSEVFDLTRYLSRVLVLLLPLVTDSARILEYVKVRFKCNSLQLLIDRAEQSKSF